MCGIAGIIAADQLTVDDRARAVRMRDVMPHRGPDGAGLHAVAVPALLANSFDAVIECDYNTADLLAKDPGVRVDEVPSGTHVGMPMMCEACAAT